MSARRSQASAIWSAAILLVSIVGIGAVAVHLGADGSGDTRNYHYYGGYALLNKPVGFDLAPAQLQTYIHPGVDTLFYGLSRLLNHFPRVFTFAWAIPQALAVWLTFHIARRCLPSGIAYPNVLAALAALIGAGGATTIGTVGTAMSEGIPNLLIMGGLLLLLDPDEPGRLRRDAVAGLLLGAAVVLKLTTSTDFIAALAALIVLRGRRVVPSGLAFGAGAFIAAAVLGLPWWLAVYRAFGNPLYPYYNTIFHSPYTRDTNMFDLRFLPRTTWEWFIYPLEWTLRKSTRVTESPVRDLRVILTLFAAFGLIVAAAFRRIGRPALACAVFAIVAYVMWLHTFSILRYFSATETLSGVVIVACLAHLLARRHLAWLPAAAATCAAILVFSTTVVPIWERRPHPGKRFAAVSVPTVPPDSVVITLGPVESAFLAAFEPASVRFIGLNNNFMRDDQATGLEPLIQRAIDAATGPIWGVAEANGFGGTAGRSLAQYGLHVTTECSPVTSTFAPPLRLCRLERRAG